MIVLVPLVGIVIAVGVMGTVLPIVPGLWLIWAACIFYGIFAGFGWVGWAAVAVIPALAVAGTIAGIYLPHRATASGGLSRLGSWFALVLGVIGFFVIPVVGAVIGFIAGVFLAAVAQTKNLAAGWRSTVAALRGVAAASAAQFAAGLVMALVWGVWVLW